MPAKKIIPVPKSALNIPFWLLIAVYTYILPNFRVIYEAILNTYGIEVVGKVPLAIVAAFGAAYVLSVLRTRKDLKNLLYLLPAALISFTIMRLEPNPNKHIHIPQYVGLIAEGRFQEALQVIRDRAPFPCAVRRTSRLRQYSKLETVAG